MYRIVKGSSQGLHDVDAFIDLINSEDRASRLFDAEQSLFVTRAPGRLDVMGGIADYSGSLVLQLPIQEATLVALQRVPARHLQIVSLGSEQDDKERVFEMPLSQFLQQDQPTDYEYARHYFKQRPAERWAAYVAGVFLVLMRELQADFPQGAHILIRSDVPEGKGMSSSAALEVSTMQAVCAAFDLTLEPREMALLCQKVENLIVGAPCGVMDQMTAVCGAADRLLALLCQPAELRESIEVPDGLRFWGIDSGVRHSISDSDYSSVRLGAFMGYRIIADLAGLSVGRRASSGLVTITDPKWRGYLANISVSEFEQNYARAVVEKVNGREFISKYAGITDAVTRVDPKRTYAVRVPTAHPVYENFRVHAFAEMLCGEQTERSLKLLGELMYQSHASYAACGLGCKATDLIVNLVRAVGSERGLYGAKITGGGSGGTVAILGRSDAESTLQEVAEQFADQTGYHPHIFRHSSPGAAAFGNLCLRRT